VKFQNDQDIRSVGDKIMKDEINYYKEILHNLYSFVIFILIISLVVEPEFLASLVQSPIFRLDAKSVSSESDPHLLTYLLTERSPS
jgi:hypothetical protein